MDYQETSREAHDFVIELGLKPKYKQKVYEHISMNGGRTCDECEFELSMSHQTCSATITGLRKEGALVDSGKRRNTRTGRRAIVWVRVKPRPTSELQQELF